jgi:hypothetical protein
MADDPTAGGDGNPAEEVVRAEVSIPVRPSSSSSSSFLLRVRGDPISARARARAALALLRRAAPDLPARVSPPRAQFGFRLEVLRRGVWAGGIRPARRSCSRPLGWPRTDGRAEGRGGGLVGESLPVSVWV